MGEVPFNFYDRNAYVLTWSLKFSKDKIIWDLKFSVRNLSLPNDSTGTDRV